MSDNEEKPICQERWFSMLLEHAVQMNNHILDEVDEEDLDETSVTVSASFILDMTDCIIEYASRYEGFAEDLDDLILMYQEQAKRQVKFGQRTVH